MTILHNSCGRALLCDQTCVKAARSPALRDDRGQPALQRWVGSSDRCQSTSQSTPIASRLKRKVAPACLAVGAARHWAAAQSPALKRPARKSTVSQQRERKCVKQNFRVAVPAAVFISEINRKHCKVRRRGSNEERRPNRLESAKRQSSGGMTA